MQRRELLQIAALWPALAASGSWAQATDYPRAGATIRYVVPFPPGGLTDVMARLVGQQLGSRWGVNVVIDNKPGSGGQIGAADVAKAAGDGHTLLAITLTHAANVTLYKGRAPYDCWPARRCWWWCRRPARCATSRNWWRWRAASR
jgi:tripartite-type tricarboxylate transporter receptor subunit TctC